MSGCVLEQKRKALKKQINTLLKLTVQFLCLMALGS